MTAPRPTARPYRDFLTPSLHRRFTNAALVTVALCYAEACWMGQWDLFWQWFPLGPTGLRTLMLFIPALCIYILRVAQLHIGARTTLSNFDSFRHYLFRLDTIQTVAWYSMSAWIFCEVYIWSAPSKANFAMVDRGSYYEPERLNERPVYLRTAFLCLALAQSAVHLYKDYDRVALPPAKIRSESTTDQSLQGVVAALTQLKQAVPRILQDSVFRIAIMSILAPAMYYLLLRNTVWHWTFLVAKNFFTLPSSSRPTTFPPYMADLMGRFLIEGLLLVLLWQFCNEAFCIFVAQEPLKKGHLLTDDSKDPNGSLIAGLKAKKEVPRNMAFWELVLIAHHYPVRRGSTFLELDRKGGSTFAQILTVCLGQLHAMVKRIQDFEKPPAPAPQPTPDAATIQTLPKIAKPLKQGDVFTTPPKPGTSYEKIASDVGDFAKAHGQSPGADPISPRARKLLTYSTDAVLSKQQQEQLSPSALMAQTQAYFTRFLQSPFGAPFRVTFSRQVKTVVLGSPIGNLGAILDATAAITKLAVCSIKDDPYGKVYHDIPNIIRTFVSTATVLDKFVQTLPPHWTDTAFDAAQPRRVAEAELILAALRSGLRDLINEFGEYADDLGLSRAELRVAKEIVAAGASG